jgi:PAS domain-containing protein
MSKPTVNNDMVNSSDDEQSTLLEKLNASELRYRRLFESTKDGILILDAETGRIVDVNPFLIAMLGYSKQNFTEKSICNYLAAYFSGKEVIPVKGDHIIRERHYGFVFLLLRYSRQRYHIIRERHYGFVFLLLR